MPAAPIDGTLCWPDARYDAVESIMAKALHWNIIVGAIGKYYIRVLNNVRLSMPLVFGVADVACAFVFGLGVCLCR